MPSQRLYGRSDHEDAADPVTGKWVKAENHHNDSTYRRHRDIIRRRDAYCVRCYVLHGLITPARDCDHYVNIAQGGTHDLRALGWFVQTFTWKKANDKKSGRLGFKPKTILSAFLLILSI